MESLVDLCLFCNINDIRSFKFFFVLVNNYINLNYVKQRKINLYPINFYNQKSFKHIQFFTLCSE